MEAQRIGSRINILYTFDKDSFWYTPLLYILISMQKVSLFTVKHNCIVCKIRSIFYVFDRDIFITNFSLKNYIFLQEDGIEYIVHKNEHFA
jgi:hypothetical protein